MLRDGRLLYHATADEAFLNDPLEHRRVAPGVPGSFRVDHRNRTALANAQAVHFRAKDASLLGKTKLLQSRLQVVPGRQSALLVAALWLGLIAAQKDVPPR